MTGRYVINIGAASAKQWVSFSYEFILNGLTIAQITLDGVTGGYAAEFDVGKEMLIYKGGTLKFQGEVVSQQSLSGGGIILVAVTETDLMDAKSPMTGSALTRAWSATSDLTILNTLVTSVAGWTTDLPAATAVDVDFRTSATESVWNAVIRLMSLTRKDIFIHRDTKELFVFDELTVHDSFSFIEGKNALNITRTKIRSKAASVLVYGKGDGDFQIIGTHGSGNPVEVVIDKNIITVGDADKKAEIEYDRLNPQQKIYKLSPTIAIDNLIIGNGGNIASNSANIDENVDIVKMKTTVDGSGVETLDLEVTNPDYRVASKNSAQISAKQEASYNQSQSAMQGAGNLSQWEGMINGSSSAGLRFVFNIGDEFEDQTGTLRINSITVDYDIDEYRRGVGTATESNKDPDIESSTNSGQDNESAEVDEDTTFNNSITFADSWTNYKSWTNILEHGEAIIFHVHLWVVDWNNPTSVTSAYTRIKHVDETDYYPSSTGLRLLRGLTQENTASDSHNHDYGDYDDVQWGSGVDEDRTTDSDSHSHAAYTQLNGNATIYIPIDPYLQDFDVELDHTGSGNGTAGVFFAYYVVSQHYHGAGTYRTDYHKHDVAVGDDVSDAGSINATSVSLYLEFWNGSSWVNKNTIASTGKTIDTGVDISDSGTYPDAKGFWRVRILTNNTSPDLIQGIVNVKHNLDN